MTEQSLFDSVLDRDAFTSANAKPYGRAPAFDGETFDHVLDCQRMNTVSRRIFDLMKDGVPRTQSEIREALGLSPDTAITSRLRDYRKRKFGGHDVIPLRRGTSGAWEYRLIVNTQS